MPNKKIYISRDDLLTYKRNKFSPEEIARIIDAGATTVRRRYREEGIRPHKGGKKKLNSELQDINESPLSAFLSKECRALALGVWV